MTTALGMFEASVAAVIKQNHLRPCVFPLLFDFTSNLLSLPFKQGGATRQSCLKSSLINHAGKLRIFKTWCAKSIYILNDV